VHKGIFINPNAVLKNTEEQLETYKRLHKKRSQGERKEVPNRVNKCWLLVKDGTR
jgi:hypothetical protein